MTGLAVHSAAEARALTEAPTPGIDCFLHPRSQAASPSIPRPGGS
jgi:hypothetical protein